MFPCWTWVHKADVFLGGPSALTCEICKQTQVTTGCMPPCLLIVSCAGPTHVLPSSHPPIHPLPAVLQDEYEENGICLQCPVGSIAGDKSGRGKGACKNCKAGFGK
jgi:hypothetical protein